MITRTEINGRKEENNKGKNHQGMKTGLHGVNNKGKEKGSMGRMKERRELGMKSEQQKEWKNEELERKVLE